MWFKNERRFVARLPPRYAAGVRALNIDAGTWRIGIPEGVEAQLVDSGNGTVIATAITASTVVDLKAPVTANLIMRTKDSQPVDLRSLILSRQ
jgi:hypothetical protein